jgi:preprotein translocase subunit SecB
MTDIPPDPGAAGTDVDGDSEARPQISVATQYVKDLSFENPNAPQSLQPQDGRPSIDVNVDVEARSVAPTNFEISLKFTVRAQHGDSVLFIIELVYCGLFVLQNIPAEHLEPVCLVECPRQLFPFARRIIADATRDGGFPPMLIDPIDFGALYQQRQQHEAEAQGKPN